MPRSHETARLAAGLAIASLALWPAARASAGACAAPPDALELRRGRMLYLQCSACHALAASPEGKVGPPLGGLFGRRAGSVEGFRYSEAMSGAGLTWTRATLERWLESPQKVIPGNVMAFAGIASGRDRKDLLDYLAAATDPSCAKAEAAPAGR